MAGEGWIPFLSRQYDDLSSYAGGLFRRPAPPPPQLEIQRRPDINLPNPNSPAPPVKPKILQAGESLLQGIKPIRDLYDDPISSIKKMWSAPEIQPTKQTIEKSMNSLSESGARTVGSALDVYNPNNTGSETKPQSDIIWEGLKGLKSGYKTEGEVATPSSEFFKRIPLEGGDPIGKAALGFGLNAVADPSNLIEPGLKGAAGLAHLAGMAPEIAHAALPWWKIKELKGIERAAHGTHAGDTEKMLAGGFKTGTSSDILGRWGHAGPITKKQVEYARAKGKVPVSAIAEDVGGSEMMPVDFPANAKLLDTTEPIPWEDVQPIYDSLHPVHDAHAREQIMKAYQEQAKYVIPHEDIIAGKVSPLPIKRNPEGLKAVNKLEKLLIDPQKYGGGVSGAHALHGGYGGGSTPLNQPSMPTDPWAGIYYHDIVHAGQSPAAEAIAFNPERVSVTDPKETRPWQKLGLSRGYEFPKDVPAPGTPMAVGPVANPQPSAQAQGLPSFMGKPINKSEQLTIKTLGKQNKLDALGQEKLKAIHAFEQAQNPQAQATAWAAGNTPAINGPEAFHDFITTKKQSIADTAKAWHSLAPHDQDTYKFHYPTSFKKYVQNAIAASPAPTPTTKVSLFDPQTKEKMQTHLNDIKDIFEDHNLTGIGNIDFDANQINADSSPYDLHDSFIKFLNSTGHDKAADDVSQLWASKYNREVGKPKTLSTPAPAATAKGAGVFNDTTDVYDKIIKNHNLSTSDKAYAFINLDHDLQKKFAQDFDYSYNTYIKPYLSPKGHARITGVEAPVSDVWQDPYPMNAKKFAENLKQGGKYEDIVSAYNKMHPNEQFALEHNQPDAHKLYQSIVKANEPSTVGKKLPWEETPVKPFVSPDPKVYKLLDDLSMDLDEAHIAKGWNELSQADKSHVEAYFPKEFGQIQDAVKLDRMEAKEAADFDFDFQGGNERPTDWENVGKLPAPETLPKTLDEIFAELTSSGFDPEEASKLAPSILSEQKKNLPSALPAGIPGFEEPKPSGWGSIDAVSNPKSTMTFKAYDTSNPMKDGEKLNGVSMQMTANPNYKKGLANDIDEPYFNVPKGKNGAAGVVIREPDGRVWIVESKGHYGGYKHTFPKGTIDAGETPQEAAIREAFEESGLQVKITGHLKDVEGTTSMTRFYTAERIGGAPWAHHPNETANVKLVPAEGHAIQGYLEDVNNQKTSHHEVLDALLTKEGSKVAPPEGYPGVSAKAQVETKNKDFQLKSKNAEYHIGGAHEKHIYTKNGQDYIFKVNKHPQEWIPQQEKTANDIAKLAGLHAPEMTVETVDGQTGTMQSVLGNKLDWPTLRSEDLTKLSTQELTDIIKHHPVDWLTSNHDAHTGQFLKTPTGIVEIDRGQAFKHFGNDKLDPNYHPNAVFGEEPPIYNKIVKLWKDGKLPQLKNKDVWGALDETILQMENHEGDIEKLMQGALERAGKTDQYQTAQERLYHVRDDIIKFWNKTK